MEMGAIAASAISGQSGSQIPYHVTPSESMWVGLAYPGKALYTDGIFDEKLKMTNCKNCAAPLNWFKQSCEYCGTFYAK